ncbi:hypothetical protein C2S51_019608 [Perilla frutescens var. frutescens]|nr:hypothetical protein C2S51_019608 [Perilla frutescens var. frutescens]
MKQDNSFTNLPPEIIIDILSRLPIRTILFPCLAVFRGTGRSKPYEIFEFVDDLDPKISPPHCNRVFNFSFPHQELIHSSVNGLLFLCNRDHKPRDIFICNPITRDYITLPPSPESSSPIGLLQLDVFGFGVSKMSGKYKLIRVFQHCSGHAASKCEVYTLGTGSWRGVAASGPLEYKWNTVGAFLNGNLHWLAYDLKGYYPRISCFDLETELFSSCSAPPSPDDRHDVWSLSALGDCLCLCDNSADDEIVIWLMKEYGDEKSWIKEFIIKKPVHRDFIGFLFPVKVFKDGDILIAEERCGELFFSNKAKTIKKCGLLEFHSCYGTSTVVYTPSFLPVKMFAMENVRSF